MSAELQTLLPKLHLGASRIETKRLSEPQASNSGQNAAACEPRASQTLKVLFWLKALFCKRLKGLASSGKTRVEAEEAACQVLLMRRRIQAPCKQGVSILEEANQEGSGAIQQSEANHVDIMKCLNHKLGCKRPPFTSTSSRQHRSYREEELTQGEPTKEVGALLVPKIGLDRISTPSLSWT